MSPLRYRDDDSQSSGLLYLAAGAVLGLAAGLVVADRFGGFSSLTARLRERVARRREEDESAAEGEEEDEVLEERVLEAFRNDPILAERAVDIGAIGDGIIELTGWVHEADEATHAVTITRGVPGVETVVNRLDVRMAEADELIEDTDDDPNVPTPGGHWEGQQVGTGRRRQGNSSERDRHADPKQGLEERWLSKEEALREAAGDIEGIAERRRGSAKRTHRGDRAGGSPIAPTGVPKADHVADPDSAPDSMRAD
jgi:BON domain-containing protein